MFNLIVIIDTICIILVGASLVALYLAWVAKKESELEKVVEIIYPVELKERVKAAVLFTTDSIEYALFECDDIRHAWLAEMNADMDSLQSITDEEIDEVVNIALAQ